MKKISMMDSNGDVKKKVGDFKAVYVSTDGWRGYYRVEATKKSGWKLLTSDWVTGDWEDAGEHAGSEVEKRLEALEKKHGEIAVVFTPTSNVFSTGFDVFIK